MPILSKKINAFAKKAADLADKPNQSGMTAAQVKAQIDSSPEELRVALNGLIDILIGTTSGDSGAKNIGSEIITGVTGTTVYDQLVDLKNQINNATTGSLPDASVTTVKLADLSVTATKLASGSVTESKLSSAYFAAAGLTGATSPSRYVGATISGAPVSGTFAVGDFVIDQRAAIWVCTVTGTPGTWKKVITPIEQYVPLWWHSGGYCQSDFTSADASGKAFVGKGTTGAVASTAVEAKLTTLSSWPSDAKFAFECTIKNTFSNGQTVNAALWDFTTGAIVPGSTVTLSSGTTAFQTIRSGQLTLTPGRQYGVTFWQPGSLSTSQYVQITGISLIVYP